MEVEASMASASALRHTLILFAETALRPIVRMLLRYGLSYPEFNQIARKLFVDIATQDPGFRLPRRRRQYKSRVALLTGLSRKEVLRLEEAPRPTHDPNIVSSNRAARVLCGWMSDARYLNEKGEPLSLPFQAGAERRSFSTLTAEHSGDIPPRAILDELLRTRCCFIGADGNIGLRQPAYIAQPFDVDAVSAAAMRAATSLARIEAQLLTETADRKTPEVLDIEREKEDVLAVRHALG